jgi:hypothetical protein
MSKVFFSTLVAALVCVASAKAENGISSQTLSDMGLSGISIMSDSDALVVRGKGFVGGGTHQFGCNDCGPRGGNPMSAVFGSSSATINLENCPDCAPGGTAHSENAYLAAGPYAASGANYSEAGAVVQKVEIVDIAGVIKSVTSICSTKVFAGGSSSAMSF